MSHSQRVREMVCRWRRQTISRTRWECDMLLNLLAVLQESASATGKGYALIGAGLAAGLAVLGAGIGIGRVGGQAVGGVGGQPGNSARIQTARVIAAAVLGGGAPFAAG